MFYFVIGLLLCGLSCGISYFILRDRIIFGHRFFYNDTVREVLFLIAACFSFITGVGLILKGVE